MSVTFRLEQGYRSDNMSELCDGELLEIAQNLLMNIWKSIKQFPQKIYLLDVMGMMDLYLN
jgi:hypothetical protein